MAEDSTPQQNAPGEQKYSWSAPWAAGARAGSANLWGGFKGFFAGLGGYFESSGKGDDGKKEPGVIKRTSKWTGKKVAHGANNVAAGSMKLALDLAAAPLNGAAWALKNHKVISAVGAFFIVKKFFDWRKAHREAKEEARQLKEFQAYERAQIEQEGAIAAVHAEKFHNVKDYSHDYGPPGGRESWGGYLDARNHEANVAQSK